MRSLVWISNILWLVIIYQITCLEALRYSEKALSSQRDYRSYLGGLSRDSTVNGVHVNQSIHLAEVLDSFNQSGYDSRIRPSFHNNTAEDIQVELFVTELGPFNDVSMDFEAEMFLRMYWTDERLRWNASEIWHTGDNSNKVLELPDSMFEDFWKPDVFFRNSKEASTHDVSQPNRMFFIGQDGSITQSERVSVTTHCAYSLVIYPFDSQRCNFQLESYKFSETEITLSWRYADAMENMNLSQTGAYKTEWKLVSSGQTTTKMQMSYNTGSFSRLIGTFIIIRDINYSVVQTYLPSILVVIMSIVGFWIDNEDAIERIALAVTTILTLTTMTEGIRNGLPKTSYVKAIDSWMLTCTILIYLALFQSAYVHYILRCGKKQSNVDKVMEESNAPRSLTRNAVTPVENFEDESEPKVHYFHLRENTPEVAMALARKVNLISKIGFPASFALVNLVYWSVLLNYYYKCMNYSECYIPNPSN